MPLSAKYDKKIFIQKEKNAKLPQPMSAKSDTKLPGFIYNEIMSFLDRF